MAMKGGGGLQKSRVHSTPRSPERPQYQVSTLTKALDTLEALAKTNADVGLTELAKRIGLSPPTLFRILSTLQARGYVQKNIHLSQYRLGLKTWEIGIAAIRRLTIREVAHPWLEQLMRETNETTHLAVLQGADIVVLERVDSPRPVRVETYMGQRAPAHCSATGKVLLAFGPDVRREELFRHKLKRFTPATLSDRPALEREFSRVRQQGYAVLDEEWQEGVCSVAVPVWDHTGTVVAAISATAPAERFSKERCQQQFVPALLHAGQAISKGLGFIRSKEEKR